MNFRSVSFSLAVATATSPNPPSPFPKAGLLVLTSCNAGIFGVPNHRVADCRSSGVCRVLRKKTVEYKISLNKVHLIKVLQYAVSSHKVHWINVLSRGNRRPKCRWQNQLQTSWMWERACSTQHSVSCIVQEGVAVLIWVLWSWRMTGGSFEAGTDIRSTMPAYGGGGGWGGSGWDEEEE